MLLRTFVSTEKMVEVGLGGMHDLFGRQRAAGMATHADRLPRPAPPLAPGMRQNGHAVLLLLAIPLMLRSAGIDCYCHPASLWAARLSRKKYAAG